jgi:hypothetical protein
LSPGAAEEPANVIDSQLAAFLEGGCALIVGTVTAEGEPVATRGWGATVVDPVEGRVRLLLSSSEHQVLDHLGPGSRLAITGADVATLRSVQVKGRLLVIEPATVDDRARAQRFCHEFYTDIVETDHTPLEIVERITPSDYVAGVAVIDDVYDQTPGPGAGARLTGRR